MLSRMELREGSLKLREGLGSKRLSSPGEMPWGENSTFRDEGIQKKRELSRLHDRRQCLLYIKEDVFARGQCHQRGGGGES